MTTSGDGVLEAVKAALATARAIEPARGKVDRAQVQAVRAAIEAMTAACATGLDAVAATDRDDAEDAIASVYARSAAVAIAAAEEVVAEGWLVEAERHARDADLRAELAAARRSPERYRALVHGRNLDGRGDGKAARALWKSLTKGDDTIARSARRQLDAPRPFDGNVPNLVRVNGCGLGFYGSRDHGSDGSYVTTHCVSVVFVPIIPLAAYRVRGASGNYALIAHEVLSPFAKIARIAMVAAIVLGIGGFALHSYLTDANRLARQRFDGAIASADGKDAEGALRRLDAELGSSDLWRADNGRVERAGAAVVRLTAQMVPHPLTAASLDQAMRVVHRYQALPQAAQLGRASDTMLATLDAWSAEVPDDAETRLALLRAALGIATDRGDQGRADKLVALIVQTRLAVASAKAAAWPLDALAILADDLHDPATLAAAGGILERLVDAPSLLDDARPDVEAWLAAVGNDDPLRARVHDALDRGAAARTEAEAEGVTPAQLAAMQKARPWDQRVGLALAHADLDAGKVPAAAARLRAFGATGVLIRDARFLLGQLAAAQGQLAEADELMSGLLGARLQRFAAAVAALDWATQRVRDRFDNQLRTGDVPAELSAKIESTTLSKAEKNDAVMAWFGAAVESDPTVSARRPIYLALSDVVPVSLAAGSVKLRRAQALDGAARDAMLQDAERTFLAIRTEAEGQPEFHLGLGEIYARLGKAAESEAEFAALIAKGEPDLSLEVARTYRSIGSAERSKQVALDVFAKAPSPSATHDNAAVLLALLTANDPDEAERWYRKADQSDPFVRVSLLELEGERLSNKGAYAACAAKFAESAKTHLSLANAASLAGYNNAALAHQHRFSCSGDLSALRDAEAIMEKAYQARSDEPIVVGNLAALLAHDAAIRTLAKRIDVRALTLPYGVAGALLDVLLAGGDRDAVLADLIADPGWRRSADLLAQFEVLAPNTTMGYELELDQASRRRDPAAAAAVLERMKRAKALDTSETAAARARRDSGALDAKFLENSLAVVAHMSEVAARPKLDDRTRAVARWMTGAARLNVGLLERDAATIASGRDDLRASMKLWPALDTNGEIVTGLIDEAAVGAPDAPKWLELRRTRTAITALAELADGSAPLAAAIRASQPWAQVPTFARADTTPPNVDDIRLAHLVDDPTLAARATAALAAPLVRTKTEVARLSDPADPSGPADLAILDGHAP